MGNMTLHAEGNPVCSFVNSADTPIQSLKAYFAPTQAGEGTPSPENVREIEGWNNVDVTQTGKNLFGGSTLKTALQKVMPVTSIDGNIVIYNNTDAALHDGEILYKAFKPNTRYTIILTAEKNTNNYTHIKVVYSDGTFEFLSGFTPIDTKVTKTFITKQNKSVVALARAADEYSVVTMYCDECGIFEGAFTTDVYEPYRGETIPVTFPVLGKNKLSDNINDYANNVGAPDAKKVPEDFKFENGEYSGTVTEGKRDYCVYAGQKTIPPGTYTLSFDYINGIQNYSWKPVICSYSNDSSWYSGFSSLAANQDNGHIEHTFSATSPFYININLNSFASAGQTAINKIYNLQLELGSSATAYEPYNPNNTVYGGYVDLAKGELVATYHTIIADGVNIKANRGSYKANGYYGGAIVYLSPSGVSTKYLNGKPTNLWCDILPIYIGINTVPTTPHVYFPLAGAAYAVFYLIDANEHPEYEGDYQAIIDYTNNWLQEHPVTITYELQTPIHYPLTPTQLTSLRGQNYIWSNTSNTVEVDYNLHETRAITSARKRIAANEPHLESVSGGIASFTTDMKAPLRECKVSFSPVQEGSGTPSPANVRPIVGWDVVSVEQAGKNLIPDDLDFVDGKWKPTNDIISGSVYMCCYFRVPKGQLYWGCEVTGQTYICLMDEPIRNGAATYNTVTTSNRLSYILDNSDGHPYMAMFGFGDGNTPLQTVFQQRGTRVYLLGHDESENPSKRTDHPITFPSPVYGGYVDLVTGEVWETWARTTNSKQVLMLNNSIYMGETSTRFYFQIPSKPASISNLGLVNLAAYTNSGFDINDDTKHNVWRYDGNALLTIRIKNSTVGIEATDDNATRIAKIKAYIAENPVDCCTPIATPVLVTTLTPTKLRTFLGTNNIWSNANGGISVSYYKH